MHLRSSEVDKLQGGISQVLAAVIKSIFLDGIWDPRLGLLLPGEPSLKVLFGFESYFARWWEPQVLLELQRGCRLETMFVVQLDC